MTRTLRKLPDLEGWEPEWGELRDKLYRFTLAAFKTVRQHYDTNPGNGTRIGELWRPLQAVLLALRVEQGEIEAVRGLFMAGAEETRHEPTPWECTLLEVLKEEAQAHHDRFEMTAPEILTAMSIEGEMKPGNKWVGESLNRYHLHAGRKRQWVGGKFLTTCSFDPNAVIEKCEIYLRTPPETTCSPVQDDNFHDNSDSCNEQTQKPDYVQACSTCSGNGGGERDEQDEQTCTCS